MDRIRSVAAAMRTTEHRLLEARLSNARWAEQLMVLVAVICVGTVACGPDDSDPDPGTDERSPLEPAELRSHFAAADSPEGGFIANRACPSSPAAPDECWHVLLR